jgi:hypothetical protein
MTVRRIVREAAYAVMFLGALAAIAQQNSARMSITPAGEHLAAVLDQMDVERHWLAGKSVKWRTGEPLDRPVTEGKSHTHCSAFVAAAAEKLGVYILRPPKHPSSMLANAQYDWLSGEGRTEGWTPVAGGLEAQQLANRGFLVVAVYQEADPKRPGHIAIVRPSTKSEATIQEEGPQIIQAGRENHASTSVKEGFKHHRAAFREGRIRYFAHPLPAR